jgi:hypothetical protein
MVVLAKARGNSPEAENETISYDDEIESSLTVPIADYGYPGWRLAGFR